MSLARHARALPRARLFVVALGALFLVNVDVASSQEQGWPRWRGVDSSGVGSLVTPWPAQPELRVRWRQEIGTGYSGIAVAEGVAVTLAAEGGTDSVVALDAGTGDVAWRSSLGTAFKGREGAVDGSTSTPAIADGIVFAVGGEGVLVALDLLDGTERWRIDFVDRFGAPVPHWGFAGSPLIVGEVVIAGTGGEDGMAMAAFDRTTGELRWRAGEDLISYQSPVLAPDRTTVIAAGDERIFGLDSETGAIRWEREHGSANFFGRIVNPVLLDEGRMLLTGRGGDSVATTTEAATGEGVVWESRFLKNNYATPVLIGDNVFGYSGTLLAAVDASTGVLAWRSRQPGDGFVVGAGRHLIAITKRGSLHIDEATADEYREVASLELFDELVWTPPSVAYGRIYARGSFGEIAAVDVVAGAVTADADISVPGKMPETEFGRWVAEVEAASESERAELIDAWLSANPQLPLREGSNVVHFAHRADVEDVALQASALGYRRQTPLHRIAGTDFFYGSFEFPSDTRGTYRYLVDLDNHVDDPLNPWLWGSRLYGAAGTLMLMPDADVPDGSVVVPRDEWVAPFDAVTVPVPQRPEFSIGGGAWGGERRIWTWLPPSYEDDPTARYPTVYVLYGGQLLLRSDVSGVVNSTLGKTAAEAIVVFIDNQSAYEYARSQHPAHEQMLIENIVPEVDARYRTRPRPEERIIVGADEAGFAAATAVLGHRDVFGKAVIQSIVPIGAGRADLLAMIGDRSAEPASIYLDWGIYDKYFAPDGTDVPSYSAELRDALMSAGHEVSWAEHNDGSDFPIWAWRLGAALERLLPRTR
ncbi:MAG: PQQ-binding-like beta-propeller repeat protein [Acidobacteria bacterium]|nr:PQQ-binding-like beta-propeller repeat protein [Acidobacteriota bacterium]